MKSTLKLHKRYEHYISKRVYCLKQPAEVEDQSQSSVYDNYFALKALKAMKFLVA